MNFRTYTVALFLVGGVTWAMAGMGDAKSVSLLASGATLRDGVVEVWWTPEQDHRIAGFHLDRLDSTKGTFSRVTPVLVPMALPFSAELESCEVVDPQALPGQPQVYRLSVLWNDGRLTTSVSFTVTPVVAPPEAAAMAVVAAVSAPTPAPLSVAGDRLKITIEQEGIYLLSAETIATGLDGWSREMVTNAIGSGGLRLSCGSNDVAWLGADGGTGLYFFARSVDSIYTRQNVYWLEPGLGAVMLPAGGGEPPPVPDGNTYRARVHYEEDTPGMICDFFCYTNTEADIWSWTYARGGYASPSTNAILKLFVSGIPEGGQESVLTVSMNGSRPTPNTPDHRANFYLNGQYLGATNWDGMDHCDSSFVVTNLVEGTNVFRIEAIKLPGDLLGSLFVIESVDLEYSRLYRAQGDALLCTGGTNAVVSVSGFTTDEIRVLDVTHPWQTMVVESAVVAAGSNNDFRIGFVPRTPTNLYYAAAGARSPVSVVGRRTEGWRQPTNEADYVVITPPAFRTQAEALALHRAGQGLKAVVADVTAIYDEFNGGVVSPHAIRAFIGYALNQWVTPPKYAVLAGAGTLDYRDVNKAWALDPCLIPPLTVYAQQCLFGSDTPLADADGDRVPDLALGRLPFVNTNEFQGWMEKMIAFESNAPGWKKVAMIADNRDAEAGDFPVSSDGLATELPGVYLADKNYLFAPTQTTAQVRARLVESFNRGCSLMTYVGHANWFTLGDEVLLDRTGVAALTNRAFAPIMVALTCEFGRFEKPVPSGNGRIGDRLVRKVGGGVVALWSAVTPTVNDDNVRIGHFLLQRLFCRDEGRLGEAVREALALEQSAWPGSSLLESYNLLGDPAMYTFLLGKRGTIAGLVLVDREGDGIVQAGDTNGLAGVTVRLLDTNGVVMATAETGMEGTYAFTNLPMGTYTIAEIDPAEHISTQPQDNRRDVKLVSEETSSGNNFYDTRLTSIGGWVLVDRNGNGTQEAGETNGLAGVTVRLLSTNGVVLATAVTGENGSYLFFNVAPGTYGIVETDPVNYASMLPAVNRYTVTTFSGQMSHANNFLNARLGTLLRIH